ncbi:glycosyltransferase [Leptolyngbya sp. NK1-12]|uniref:Glycosyltransferase n=1 Tax=Leptolyngbya sp. NK1-12 TaxID=2547451 RepID=A0AA96WLA6_9CYAN|nr:glycosyltransferase [Leptolyngbya sp. NK1-12]
MSPLITIVTTVYNRERYLDQAIESVLTQTYDNLELLIWDDGSTDRSIEIAHYYAKQDNRVRVIAADHRGQGRALRAAFAQAAGEYIGQVDSDDVLASTALEATAAVLDAQPSIGLVYTDYMVIDEKGWIQGQGERCKIPYSQERLLIDFMIFHFRLMRRSIYNHVGGIDPGFEYAEDYELCLRLSEVTEIYQIKQPLYYYRVHQQSLSCHRRIEQILQSHKAISQALERRGLADQFESHVEISATFSIRAKS